MFKDQLSSFYFDIPKGIGGEMQSGAKTVKVVPSKYVVNRAQG